MIDAIGNTLATGDKVVYSWSDSCCMSPATIVGFTGKKVHIEFDHGGRKYVKPSSLCCYMRKDPIPFHEYIIKAKELINEYYLREFGNARSLDDACVNLENVPLAYTTAEDDEFAHIQINANLYQRTFTKYINDKKVYEVSYARDKDFLVELEYMTFDSLISID